MNCIAIDDEPLALKLLADNISKVPYLKLIASCEDAFEASKLLQEHKIDLIFIDIQMPGLTGLQFIGSLTVKPLVMIITAYKQYALEGYSLDVVDYLIKPVPIDRFIKACNKAQELFQLKNRSFSSPEMPGYIFVNIGYSMFKVTFSDILYIEGLKDYIRIHLASTSKAVIARMGMKEMLDQLSPSQFIQIHKSYIVAIDRITAIKKDSVILGDTELFIGKTFKEEVRKLLKSNYCLRESYRC